MPVEVRKIISAPLIEKGVREICDEQGISPTEYAYKLIVADVIHRNSSKTLSINVANNNLNIGTFIGEVKRVMDKYAKLPLE